MTFVLGAKQINWGVDYLRVTSRFPHDHVTFEQEFQRVLKKDQALGYKPHAGGAFGFWGTATRHALLARKEDWHMLQVTGRAAKGLEQVAKVTQNCTRIDVQVTFRVAEGKVAETIMSMYKEAMAQPYGEGRRPSHKLVLEEWDAQTAYIGKRSSDYFIRIYDKFAESGDENYRDCVRVEIEIKGKTSKGLWKHMASEGCGEGYLIQVLYDQMNRHGITMPDAPGGTTLEVYKPTQARLIDNTVAWLTRAVAPAMQRVVTEFGWLLPIRLLFDDILKEEEMASLCQNLAVLWGS